MWITCGLLRYFCRLVSLLTAPIHYTGLRSFYAIIRCIIVIVSMAMERDGSLSGESGYVWRGRKPCPAFPMVNACQRLPHCLNVNQHTPESYPQYVFTYKHLFFVVVLVKIVLEGHNHWPKNIRACTMMKALLNWYDSDHAQTFGRKRYHLETQWSDAWLRAVL